MAKDLDYCRLLYAQTREKELSQVQDWSEEFKQQFLDQQFEAQHSFYTKSFPNAHFEMIEYSSRAVGRLYWEIREDDLRIIDIIVDKQFQKKGIGSFVLNRLMQIANMHGKPIRIHVERFNPASNWYEKLGFKYIGDNGVYMLMEYPVSTNELCQTK